MTLNLVHDEMSLTDLENETNQNEGKRAAEFKVPSWSEDVKTTFFFQVLLQRDGVRWQTFVKTKTEVNKVKMWPYLLKSERFCEKHEGQHNSHGLPPSGHCKQENLFETIDFERKFKKSILPSSLFKKKSLLPTQ